MSVTPRRYIMVHHSLTKDGDTVSWGAIERYHRGQMGWTDIGYSRGVELIDGSYYALVGRDEHLPAAACKEGGMNVLAYHVCCVGNFDLAPPPRAMLEVLVRRVIRPWMERDGITPERIVGHRDYAPYKTCPGTRFDLDALRAMVR